MSDRLDARIRKLTFRLIEMAPEAPPFPEEPMVQLRPSPTQPAQSARRLRPAWAVAAALAVIVAIAVPAVFLGGPDDVAAPPDSVPSEITVPSTTPTTPSSSVPAPSTTPVAGLDLSGTTWVTHGPDGIRLDDGTLLWETEYFPAGIARDREGGFAFTDVNGLWWFAADAPEPTLVLEGEFDLISVVPSQEGPVAVMRPATFVRLTDGASVSDPDGSPTPLSETLTSYKWTADNGLTAWVVPPVIEYDSDGQPSLVLEQARLVVARGEDTIFDVQIGVPDEEWATLRDFDGRTIIVSRGPFEPAMPPETFFVIDLACGDCTRTFTASGGTATLTGPDVDWDGPVETPQLVDATTP